MLNWNLGFTKQIPEPVWVLGIGQGIEINPTLTIPRKGTILQNPFTAPLPTIPSPIGGALRPPNRLAFPGGVAPWNPLPTLRRT